jgi:hypothetical protein
MQTNCLITIVAVAALLTGCGTTVNYNPATNPDGTAPTVNLLIKRYGEPDLEVQERTGPSQNLRGDYGNPIPNKKLEFSILATAKDAESGIKTVKLKVTRTVCFQTTGGVIAAAPFATQVVKEASYSDQQNAPTAVSLGFTGIIDNTSFAKANPSDDNLLVFTNAQGNRIFGVGVATYWSMETENFAGATTGSDIIYITAGDLSCPIIVP